jgi:r-opsin
MIVSVIIMAHFLALPVLFLNTNFCAEQRYIKTPSNMSVVNLAIMDFLMMLKTPVFIYNSFHKGFAAGHLTCHIFAFVGSCSGIGAAVTNACIAYDRYT